jgi:hypothetical protein
MRCEFNATKRAEYAARCEVSQPEIIMAIDLARIVRKTMLDVLVSVGLLLVSVVFLFTIAFGTLRVTEEAQRMQVYPIERTSTEPPKDPLGIPADPWIISQGEPASPEKDALRDLHLRL